MLFKKELKRKEIINEPLKNNKKDFDRLIDELLSKIKNLPSGTETSISSLLGNNSLNEYNEEELNRITSCIWERCETENILLDFPNDNVKTGLIYNITFIKK